MYNMLTNIAIFINILVILSVGFIFPVEYLKANSYAITIIAATTIYLILRKYINVPRGQSFVNAE